MDKTWRSYLWSGHLGEKWDDEKKFNKYAGKIENYIRGLFVVWKSDNSNVHTAVEKSKVFFHREFE